MILILFFIIYKRDHHFSEQLVRFDSLSFQMFPSEKSSGMGVFGKLVGGWCGCSKEVEPNFHADPWLLERERAIDWILMNGFDLYDTPVSAAVFIEPWTSKFCVRRIFLLQFFRFGLSVCVLKLTSDSGICVEQKF